MVPWEQIASNIAKGLIEKGFDVTLFATGDSITKGKLEFVCEQPYAEHPKLDVKAKKSKKKLIISGLIQDQEYSNNKIGDNGIRLAVFPINENGTCEESFSSILFDDKVITEK